MRLKLGERGIGGNKESWFYLEFNEENGQFYIVHEWSNMGYDLQTDEGEEKTPLHQAKDSRYYKEAINIIKTKVFEIKK